jgi:hypothetical protein
MASSFIAFNGNGFWAKDGFIEAFQLLLFESIESEYRDRIEWLNEYKKNLAIESLHFAYGAMSMQFDEMLTDHHKVAQILALIKNIKIRISKDSNYLTGAHLNALVRTTHEFAVQIKEVSWDKNELEKFISDSEFGDDLPVKLYEHGFGLLARLLQGETFKIGVDYWEEVWKSHFADDANVREQSNSIAAKFARIGLDEEAEYEFLLAMEDLQQENKALAFEFLEKALFSEVAQDKEHYAELLFDHPKEKVIPLFLKVVPLLESSIDEYGGYALEKILDQLMYWGADLNDAVIERALRDPAFRVQRLIIGHVLHRNLIQYKATLQYLVDESDIYDDELEKQVIETLKKWK